MDNKATKQYMVTDSLRSIMRVERKAQAKRQEAKKPLLDRATLDKMYQQQGISKRRF